MAAWRRTKNTYGQKSLANKAATRARKAGYKTMIDPSYVLYIKPKPKK